MRRANAGLGTITRAVAKWKKMTSAVVDIVKNVFLAIFVPAGSKRVVSVRTDAHSRWNKSRIIIEKGCVFSVQVGSIARSKPNRLNRRAKIVLLAVIAMRGARSASLRPRTALEVTTARKGPRK